MGAFAVILVNLVTEQSGKWDGMRNGMEGAGGGGICTTFNMRYSFLYHVTSKSHWRTHVEAVQN